MTSHSQALPRNLIQEMLQLVARAICERPGENPAKFESRTNQMVHTTLGFCPRDGLELMLASVAFGHFNLLLDSMRDVFQGQPDGLKARTKTTIVALNRAMLEVIKELRVERRRPAEQPADTAQNDAAGTVAAAERPVPPMPQHAQPAAAMSSRPGATPAGAEPAAHPLETASNLAPTQVSGSNPLLPDGTVPDDAMRNSVPVEGSPSALVGALPDRPAWTEEDEAAVHTLIATNEALMAAMNESVAEAWREHRANEAAVSGD